MASQDLIRQLGAAAARRTLARGGSIDDCRRQIQHLEDRLAKMERHGGGPRQVRGPAVSIGDRRHHTGYAQGAGSPGKGGPVPTESVTLADTTDDDSGIIEEGHVFRFEIEHPERISGQSICWWEFFGIDDPQLASQFTVKWLVNGDDVFGGQSRVLLSSGISTMFKTDRVSFQDPRSGDTPFLDYDNFLVAEVTALRDVDVGDESYPCHFIVTAGDCHY